MEKFLEHRIGFNEYITGNRFIDICENSSATFCKTDFLSSFTGTPQETFVTHNSDYHINNTRRSMGPKYIRWFAQNKDCNDDKIIPIPIGLENMRLRTNRSSHGGLFSSEVKGSYQKALLIDRINNLSIEKKNLAYLNFNINTYPVERKAVWDLFKTEKWVTATSRIPMEKFYFDLASHKFVFSPRGNGVDCHRAWEALYLRTIPIVRKTTHTKEFSDLPIFFLDNWDEVCYTTLVGYYEKVKSTLYNLDKMKISYWRKRINEKSHI